MDLKNDSPVQNAPNPPPSTRQSKANISFSQKLPKGDLKDPTSMKTYLSTLADVLPSINELAAAIILGHDFESTRNQISFNSLMKISDTEQIMQLEFTEVTRNNEEPAAHFDQNETSSGKDLIAADRILKSIFALSTTQDTLQTLSAFGTAVEKVEHIRTSLMLKTHSDTTRLFSFLLINNFSDFGKFSTWSAHVYKHWLEIDFDNIDRFDLLKFVLTNTSTKYKPIMEEIMLNHPNADFSEMNTLVSKWEEVHRTINSRWYRDGRRDNPRRPTRLAHAAQTRSDGSHQLCDYCGGNHKTDDCYHRNAPSNHEQRHNRHMDRSNRQNRRNQNRKNQKPYNDKNTWRNDEHPKRDTQVKQIEALQRQVKLLLDTNSGHHKAKAVTFAATPAWSGVPTIAKPHAHFKANMIRHGSPTDPLQAQKDFLDTLSYKDQQSLMEQLQARRSPSDKKFIVVTSESGKVTSVTSTSSSDTSTNGSGTEQSPTANDTRKVGEGDYQPTTTPKKTTEKVDEQDLVIDLTQPTADEKKPAQPLESYDSKSITKTIDHPGEKTPPPQDATLRVDETDSNLSQTPSCFHLKTFYGESPIVAPYREESEDEHDAAHRQYTKSDENLLAQLLINKRTRALATVNSEIQEAIHRLQLLKEKKAIIQAPVSELITQTFISPGHVPYTNSNTGHRRETPRRKHSRGDFGNHSRTRPAYSATPKRNRKHGFQRRKPGPKHANNLRAVECAKIDSLRTSNMQDTRSILNKRMNKDDVITGNLLDTRQILSKRMQKVEKQLHDRLAKHNAHAARLPNKYDTEWIISQNNSADKNKHKVDPNSWLLDSGASVTYVNDKKWLHDIKPVCPPIPISSAISGEDELCHEFGYLPNGIEAFYMPGFTDNLLSAQAISEVFGPLTINASSAIANAHDPDHAFVVATFDNFAYRVDPWEYFGLPRDPTYDLHDMNTPDADEDDIIFRAASGTIKDLDAAQQLFYQTGAPGKSTLAALHKHMDGLEKADTATLRQLYKHFDVKETVARSRAVASSFKRTKLDKRSYKFLEKICLDTAHETQNPSVDGYLYWEAIKCYHSGFTWVLLLTHIKDLAHKLPRFLTDIQNRCGMAIHIIKTDGHLCYQNQDIQTYLSRHGISHETNIPHTSQQNGRAETAICKIRNRARALLVAAKLDVSYWSFAIQESARVGNLLPSTANPENRSPYEMATGEQPHASQLLLFGSIAWVRTTPTDRTGKMESVAAPYIYVGQDRKGYILLDPRMTEEVTTHHATHVTFDQSRTWTPNYVNEIAYEQAITRILPTSTHHLRPYIFALDTHTANDDSDDDLVPLDTTAIHVENFQNSNPLMLEGSDDEPTTHELESPVFSTAELPTTPENATPLQTPHKKSYAPSTPPQPREKPATPAGEPPVSENITPPQTPHTSSGTNNSNNVYDMKSHEPRYKTRLQTRLKRVLAGHKNNRLGKTPYKAHVAMQKRKPKVKSVNWMPAKDKYIIGVDEACRIPLPHNLDEALAHPMWKAAIIKEIESIKGNKTFKFVPRTHASAIPKKMRRSTLKSLRTHFVFRAKPDKDGKLLKLKARLVANGNNQEEGINYFASYAPVISSPVLKVQFVHGLINGMEAESWDYSSAFLQGQLDEIIYITLPGDPTEYGIDTPEGCRILLEKSIYGLVQAGNVWFNLLKSSLLKAGFEQCPYEQCLFIKRFEDGSSVNITTYVDDLCVTSDSQENLDSTFKILSTDLKIGNREKLSWHIGMRFRRSGNSATIDQSAYTIQTINEFNMAYSKTRSTPKKLETTLSKHDAPKDDESFQIAQKLPYRKLIGKLMHLGRQTRADISEATADCSRFLHNWGLTHWQAGKDILRYLRQSHDICLVYHPERTKSPIEVYVDAAYAKDQDDRHSHTGICVFYYGCLVHWISRKQKSVTLSSCEAEYVALTDAAKETIHLRRIINFLDKDFDPNVPTKIHEDNQGTIALAYSDGKTQARTKHIDIRMHFIREYISQGIIEIDWVDTNNQKADFFTKPLSGPKHERMRHMNMNCDAAPTFDEENDTTKARTENKPDDEPSPKITDRGVAEVA